MSNLKFNTRTGEPFLRLPSPLGHIIITPPRLSDAPYLPGILDDPAVHPWLRGPPYPYPPEAAIPWLESIIPPCEESLRQLQDASASQERKVVGACVVRYLRHVKPDGTDEFIGDISIERCPSLYLQFSKVGVTMSAEAAEAFERENTARPVGDPEVVWTIGNFLAPSYHGQGIMTAAVGTILDWAVARMGVRRILVSAFTGNRGSVRVFEKNGFTLLQTLEDCIEVRGVRRGMHFLEWKKDEG